MSTTQSLKAANYLLIIIDKQLADITKSFSDVTALLLIISTVQGEQLLAEIK